MQKNILTESLLTQKAQFYEALEIDHSDVIEKQVEVAIGASEHGNTLGAISNLNRIGLLLGDLNEVESTNTAAYRSLRKDLRNAKDDLGSFHGTRFEISVAAQLCLRKVVFTKQERPDFKIGNVGIECTSCRKAGGKADAERKFMEAISKKSSMPYASKDCILKIDVTNLFFNADPSTWQSLLHRLTEVVASDIESWPFGAVGIYVFRQSQNRLTEFGYGFNVVAAKNGHVDMIGLVDAQYPNIGVTLSGPGIPKES